MLITASTSQNVAQWTLTAVGLVIGLGLLAFVARLMWDMIDWGQFAFTFLCAGLLAGLIAAAAQPSLAVAGMWALGVGFVAGAMAAGR